MSEITVSDLLPYTPPGPAKGRSDLRQKLTHFAKMIVNRKIIYFPGSEKAHLGRWEERLRNGVWLEFGWQAMCARKGTISLEYR